ncbi:MAG: type II toxin-antitoxin system HicA family toxin [Bacteroidetes bacterium]|nr:type II toxin-antitoxin system HicA family toxin [Bacteroidota bacterium]
MKLPRDLSGTDLAKALRELGYVVVRQRGSHLMLTTSEHGEHHIAIPLHDPLKLGTLMGILNDVAQHFKLSRDELSRRLFE